jgi:hypothetical protein
MESTKIKQIIKNIIRESILSETNMNLTLYHGALKSFKSFKPTTTFFSDDPNFAINYAHQKSADSQMDADPVLYTVKVTGNIFDIHNKADYKKLEAKLPDEISYYYNNYGFKATESKEEYLRSLSGIFISEPIDGVSTAKIGSKIPDPHYKQDDYIVYDIDSEYVYCYREDTYIRESAKLISKYSDEFSAIYKLMSEYIKELNPNAYINNELIKQYYYVFYNKKMYASIPVPQKQYLIEFDKLHKEFEKDIIKKLVKQEYVTKFNRKTRPEKLSNTWRFYENVTTEKLIKSLGYIGYIALEDGKNTYSIFDPTKSATIIKKTVY